MSDKQTIKHRGAKGEFHFAYDDLHQPADDGVDMKIHQELIVFIIWAISFVALSVALPNFFTEGNLISLLRSVSVLGILAIGMAIVVIGRGIDLAMVATMAVSVAGAIVLLQQGYSIPVALLAGFVFAVLVGTVSGILIAYVEIPALFATLAMGLFIYGVGRFGFFNQDIVLIPPEGDSLSWLGAGRVFGIPVSILFLLLFAGLVALFLRYARIGRFIHAIGDNPSTARITGLPVRKLYVLSYILSSTIAYCAGIITATGVGSMNTRIVNSTMLYDVILVVVIGGISLSGGKGGVRNVLVGTLLIGTLLNAMTIMDIQYTVQNVIKSMILLIAIIVDSLLNPRDEQTAQQGDI